jgi:hypothetical protein
MRHSMDPWHQQYCQLYSCMQSLGTACRISAVLSTNWMTALEEFRLRYSADVKWPPCRGVCWAWSHWLCQKRQTVRHALLSGRMHCWSSSQEVQCTDAADMECQLQLLVARLALWVDLDL